jgi:regulator of replication initiation timing
MTDNTTYTPTAEYLAVCAILEETQRQVKELFAKNAAQAVKIDGVYDMLQNAENEIEAQRALKEKYFYWASCRDKRIAELVKDNKALTAENTALRRTLSTLAQIAGDAAEADYPAQAEPMINLGVE